MSVTAVSAEERSTAGDDSPRRRTPAWLNALLLGVIFGVAYSQFPLYFLVQNQYFFYARVRNGFGFLRSDWLAGTFDPWPVFTQVAYLTYHYLDQRAFYFYFVVLLGIYAYSMVGIASSLFGIGKTRLRYLSFLALFVAVHSPLLGWLSEMIVGLDLRTTLIEGVASQRILWEMFQPGAFGVLLLLSLHLFLRGRPFLAVVSSSLAVAFNPTYVLSAGILTLAYVLVLVRRGDGIWRSLAVGACALVVVLPTVATLSAGVRPTTPAIWAQAQDVLVNLRLSVHALPATWFDAAVYVKVAVVLGALYVVRRTELFAIMLLSSAATVGLTLLQVLSGNNTLALLYPWRLSVVLVPLSTVILIASALSRVLDRGEPRLVRGRGVLVALSSVMIAVLMVGGAIVTARRFGMNLAREAAAVTRFVGRTKSAGETYLLPLALSGSQDSLGYSTGRTQWYHFRLSSGAPAFVDWGFIPYKDTEVLQWYERVRAADAFYTADRDVRCRMAGALRARYGVTHIILKSNDPAVCGSWRLVERDDNYTLFTVAPD